MKLFASALALVAALAACTTHEIVTVPASALPGALPLGGICNADDDCSGGLACKPLLLDDACSAQKACTAVCDADATCAALDARGKCMDGCDGEQVCVLTERKTTDLTLGSVCEASAECVDGLKCLVGSGSKAECGAQRTCSLRCTEDADCGDLDESARCLPGCDGRKLCQLTATE